MSIMNDIKSSLSQFSFVTGDGVSAEKISDFERQLDLILPADFKAYLSRFGWLEFESEECFGLGVGIPAYLDLVQIVSTERVAGLPCHLLPIRNNGFGDLDCIDLMASGLDISVIVCFEHDTHAMTVIAHGFDQWLEELLALIADQ